MNTKLAIVGSGSKTRDLAPWDDLETDIWVINEAPLHPWCKRWDACFQLHSPTIYTADNDRHVGYWEWMQEWQGEDKVIWMQDLDYRVPNAMMYPLNKAIELGGRRYLTSTIAYMAALALIQNYKDVTICGVDLSATEYQYQAECWRFWVGMLIGRLGADHVHILSGKYLLEAKLYGYEAYPVITGSFFADRVATCKTQLAEADAMLDLSNNNLADVITHSKFSKITDAVLTMRTHAHAAGLWAAALGEAERNTTHIDFSDRSLYEVRAATAQKNAEQKRCEMYHMGGRIEYISQAWEHTTGQQHQQAQLQLISQIQTLSKLAYELGAMEGAFSENQIYINEFDALTLASGGKMTPVSEAFRMEAKTYEQSVH